MFDGIFIKNSKKTTNVPSATFSGNQSGNSMAMPPVFHNYDVVLDCFVFDVSGSMEEPSFQKDTIRLQTVMGAGKRYLDAKRESRPRDCVALVAYSSDVSVMCGFEEVQSQYQMLASAIWQMQFLPHGGTDMSLGLQAAIKLFHEHGGDDFYVRRYKGKHVLRRVIAYSDGHDQNTHAGLELAKTLKGEKILIETFGIAPSPKDVDEKFLKAIATTDEQGCHYRFLGDTETVYNTFQHMASGTLLYTE